MALAQLASAAKRLVGALGRRSRDTRRAANRPGLAISSRRAAMDRRRPPQMPDFSVPEGPLPPPVDAETYLRNLQRIAEGIPADRDVIESLVDDREGAPPRQWQPPQPPPPVPPGVDDGDGDGDEEFDDIETLGRDYGYDVDDWALQQEGQIQVSSTNVYSYFYQAESKYTGILYVTFLAPAPKGQPRTSPGPSYAYYNISRGKYARFRREAEASAGSAVWDHLRVRGTLWEHQHQYRLISVSGDYVPRRATARGFRTRYLRPIGRPRDVNERLQPGNREQQLARRGFRRSTLPEQLFDSARPDRGGPDRGTPDRG